MGKSCIGSKMLLLIYCSSEVTTKINIIAAGGSDNVLEVQKFRRSEVRKVSRSVGQKVKRLEE